jgi:leucine dehydrogenase
VGVFHGIVAACLHAFGTAELADRTVLVQGAGAVGGRLAELLHDAGATVRIADVDRDRAAAVADAAEGSIVEPDAVIGTPCDVYAPCATGAVLTGETIPRLACAIVAGAANNQLGELHDADLLRARGIVYAPDFVINAGGVLHLAGYETLGWDDAAMASHLAGIGARLEGIFREADRDGRTTVDVADRIARATIEAGRPS